MTNVLSRLRPRLVAPALALALLGGSFLARAETAPAIAPDAQNVVVQMGKTLSSGAFSFQIHTICEYVDDNGQPLHIFHTIHALVRRPDRLLVTATGDDGTTKIVYDGKNLTVYREATNKYLSVAVSGSLEDVLRDASERLGLDFPLADLLANDPAQAFLHGVIAGNVVGTVTVDGVPCLHMIFLQPPGIELELWAEKNQQALPRRLIVTYRSLPGEPRFIAVMSDWSSQRETCGFRVCVSTAAGCDRDGGPEMKTVIGVTLLALMVSSQAFGWGAVEGRYGGAAYRGPGGATAVRTPSGAAAYRGPAGGAAYRPPGAYGGYHPPVAYYGGYHPPAYGGGAAFATGAAVGVAVGAAAARPYYPPPPPPVLCAAARGGGFTLLKPGVLMAPSHQFTGENAAGA